jgi:hypothetical protein
LPLDIRLGADILNTAAPFTGRLYWGKERNLLHGIDLRTGKGKI